MQATGLQGGRVLNPNDRAKRARARACFAISYAFALSALGAPALGCAMMCVRCRRPPSNACRLQTTQLPFAATERARRTVLEPRLSRREAAAAAASYWPHQHAAPEPDVMPRCFTALLCLCPRRCCSFIALPTVRPRAANGGRQGSRQWHAALAPRLSWRLAFALRVNQGQSAVTPHSPAPRRRLPLRVHAPGADASVRERAAHVLADVGAL